MNIYIERDRCMKMYNMCMKCNIYKAIRRIRKESIMRLMKATHSLSHSLSTLLHLIRRLSF